MEKTFTKQALEIMRMMLLLTACLLVMLFCIVVLIGALVGIWKLSHS